MFFLFFHYISNAAQSIWANKLRSFLSMLGIIIGIVSVTVFLAIGKGAEAEMRKYMDKFAQKKIEITNGADMYREQPMDENAGIIGVSKEVQLTLDDITYLKKHLHTTDKIIPVMNSYGNIIYGTNEKSSSIVGVLLDHFTGTSEDTIRCGRSFSEQDWSGKTNVAVVNYAFVKQILNNEPSPWEMGFASSGPPKVTIGDKALYQQAIGRQVSINNRLFQIVGVTNPPENPAPRDEVKAFVLAPTFQQKIMGTTTVDGIQVLIQDTANIAVVEAEVRYLLLKKYNIAERKVAGFTVRNMSKFQQEQEDFSAKAKLILMGIGAISLLVGGIGVMNIMLVSVTERTREIGIRKAIGAKRYHIIGQFLTESIVISICGGAIAIAASYGITQLLKSFEIPVLLSSDVMFQACIFALSVGVVFGILPARKAALLKPIDALRFE